MQPVVSFLSFMNSGEIVNRIFETRKMEMKFEILMLLYLSCTKVNVQARIPNLVRFFPNELQTYRSTMRSNLKLLQHL